MAIALDHNGPRDIPFVEFESRFAPHSIISRFRDTASRFPEKPAIVDGDCCLTYSSLCHAIWSLAARLEQSVPGPGAIGILLSPSADYWIALFACFAVQRPCIALDLRHPARRNAEIVRTAGMTAVLTPEDFRDDDGLIPAELPRFAVRSAGSPEVTALPVPATFAPDRPAAILYTSGSTGRPKGVANGEAALLQRVAQYVNACHLHAADRFLTLSSPCTIAGLREGLTALLIGATLHLVDTRVAGLGEVARTIRDARITILNAIPSVLRALIAGQPDAATMLASLRIVRIGGEVVFWSDLRLYRNALPRSCYIQIGYSSTEATGTQWFVPPDALPSGPFVPVGYVLPGNVASIVDDTMRPSAPGEVGELVLSSRFIALGTWENGRCNADAFRSQAANPNVRVLRTGDLARIDADGLCTIVGRKDRQVKINGMRIEPAEIEAALRDMPEVADAAVIALRAVKTATLIAFVVPAQANLLETEDIRAALRLVLPSPMRPSQIHVIDTIPHLPSGKLDVRSLEMLARDLDAAPAEVETALNAIPDVHEAARRAWRNVLGRRSLIEGQSFEAAGGDSLKLLQLVLWLETLLDRHLPLDLLSFDMRVDDLAAILRRPDLAEAPSDRTDRRPTIFLLPGLDGDEPRLVGFRAALSEQVRFVLIDYPDWPQMVLRGAVFEALIEAAVQQIVTARPGGPILLAGYSFGGDVAFAAAARLIELGHDVGFLGILDTDLERVAADAELYRTQRNVPFSRHVHLRLAQDRLHSWFGFFLAKCARDMVGLERTLRYEHLWQRLIGGRIAFAFHRRIRTILRLQAQWRWHGFVRPPVIDVPTVLFRSNGHADNAAWGLGWEPRCSNLNVVPVEGDHRAMLELPHRTLLCARFAEAVADVAFAAPAIARRWRRRSDQRLHEGT